MLDPEPETPGGEEGIVPASNKVGTQLLVSPQLRDRARALAIVRQESVAEVWRAALEYGGIPHMELVHAGPLARLEDEIRAAGGDRSTTLERMLRERPQGPHAVSYGAPAGLGRQKAWPEPQDDWPLPGEDRPGG